MSSIKQEVHNLSQCCQRRTDRVTAISNTGKTFGEDRTYSIGDMLADRHTNIQNTDKQTRSYQISIFRHPYRERSNYDIFILKYTDLVKWTVGCKESNGTRRKLDRLAGAPVRRRDNDRGRRREQSRVFDVPRQAALLRVHRADPRITARQTGDVKRHQTVDRPRLRPNPRD